MATAFLHRLPLSCCAFTWLTRLQRLPIRLRISLIHHLIISLIHPVNNISSIPLPALFVSPKHRKRSLLWSQPLLPRRYYSRADRHQAAPPETPTGQHHVVSLFLITCPWIALCFNTRSALENQISWLSQLAPGVLELCSCVIERCDLFWITRIAHSIKIHLPCISLRHDVCLHYVFPWSSWIVEWIVGKIVLISLWIILDCFSLSVVTHDWTVKILMCIWTTRHYLNWFDWQSIKMKRIYWRTQNYNEMKLNDLSHTPSDMCDCMLNLFLSFEWDSLSCTLMWTEMNCG